MPNFKPKSKKITINNKSIVTLDSKHNEKMQEFENITTKIIPELKKEKKEIKEKLKGELPLTERMDLNDKLRDIRKKIKKLKKEEKNYLLDNSTYIFEYFEKKRIYLKVIQRKRKSCIHFLTKI